MGVSGLPRKKKSDTRYAADLASAFGWECAAKLLTPEELGDYGTYVGLWRNLDRALYRQAISVCMGVVAAMNGNELSRQWFDALAEHESQIDELAYVNNSERQKEQVRAKHGVRRG